MNLSTFLLFTVFYVNCVAAVRENQKTIPKSSRNTSLTDFEIGTPTKEFASKENSREIDNSETERKNSYRKSKLIRNLAFMAGVDTQTLAKLSVIPVNGISVSSIQPQIAVYDPYPYSPSPYVFASPIEIYSLWDMLRLQPVNRIYNHLQPASHNLQSNKQAFSNKDKNGNEEDEFVDEAKKVEHVKTFSKTGERVKVMEIQDEDDRNSEEKVSSTSPTCVVQKDVKLKQGASSKFSEEENVSENSLIKNLRAADMANQAMANQAMGNQDMANQTMGNQPMANQSMGNQSMGNQPPGNNATGLPPTMPMENPAINNTAPYGGYYGGQPQNINHIDLTTDSYEHKYHDLDHGYYALPSYEPPLNFYADDRYNYYHPPPSETFADQFREEQVPEYFSNNFKRFVYSSEKGPTFDDGGFRPIV